MEQDLTHRHLLYGCVAIALLTFLVYASSLGNGFVSLDDGLLMYKNPLVQRTDLYTLKRIFTSYDPELYIPLTLSLYQFIHTLFGSGPSAFHTMSLFLHIANALLVVWVTTLLCKKRWMGLTVGLLFALHPLHTEAVAWASGMKDLLSGFFFLLSVGFYIGFLDNGDRKHLSASTLAFALGLLSKVVIIFLPVVLLLIDHQRGRKVDRNTILEKKIFFALSILFTCIAVGGKVHKPYDLSLFETVLLSCKSIFFYLRQLLVPGGFSVLYPQESPISLYHAEFFLPALFTVALLGLWWISLRKSPRIGLALGLFLLPLLPNFINFSKNGYLFFASDRYAYLPSIGIFLLLVMFAEQCMKNRKKAQLCSALLVLILAVFVPLTRTQSLTWKNSDALHTNILQEYPHSTMALNNLGSVRMAEGNTEEALRLFTDAYSREKQHSTAAINIGIVYLQKGDLTQAEEWYKKAIAELPVERAATEDELIPYYFLADLREKMGFPEEALALYKEAVAKGESYAEPHINLGIAYQKRRRLEEAEQEFRAAIGLNRYLPTPHYNLAGILAETGYLDDAERELKTVLRIDPNFENANRHLENIQRLMQK